MRRMKSKSAHLVAAASVAAFAVAALAAEPRPSPARQSLEDVQIGEQGAVLRVALICTTRCEIAPGADASFVVSGVAADLDIDLAARSALARRLTVKPAAGGSVLKVVSAARLNEARIVDCVSDSGPAPCVEFRFEQAEAPVPAAATPPAERLREKKPAQIEAMTPTKDDIPFIGAVILAPGPALRDQPAPGLLYLPRFAPPERFAPPPQEPADGVDVLGDLSGNVDIGRPSLIPVDRAEALGQGAAFDFKSEAIAILGKSFEPGVCEGAKARLQGDAWALGAMIDFAFCKAGDGKLEEADADFARLLAYTPDNYEALVGRGLIAIAAGDAERGRVLFQDALNALPPIDESDRIVEAMERN